MKQIAAAILSALLCVQPVYAMQIREPVLYTDTQEESGVQEESEAQEKTDAQEKSKARETTESGEESDGQENSGAQESADTQGEPEAAEEQPDPGTSGEEDIQDQSQDQSQGAGGVEVSAPSAILMEVSTGQVIYDKDADTQRPPASVTKVMTLLLIFDALNDGKIKLEDEVTTSEYAASMGGSQVFLEPGEVQTVDTLIKCISVASANDACAALKKRRQKMQYLMGSREYISSASHDP